MVSLYLVFLSLTHSLSQGAFMKTGLVLNLTGKPRHETFDLPATPPMHGGRMSGEIDGVAMLDVIERALTKNGHLPGLDRLPTEMITRVDLLAALHTERNGRTLKERKQRLWNAFRYYFERGEFHPQSVVGAVLRERVRDRLHHKHAETRRAS